MFGMNQSIGMGRSRGFDMNGMMSRMRGDVVMDEHLPTRTLARLSSDVFLWAAGLSIVASLGLRLAGRRHDALFVGEWPPTLATLGVMTRLLAR